MISKGIVGKPGNQGPHGPEGQDVRQFLDIYNRDINVSINKW